jgi:16S rRNA processing protein RimM
MPQKFVNEAGSQKINEPAFLVLGKLRRPHGVQGEIPLELYTSMLELLEPGRIVYISEDHHPHKIGGTRWKQDLLLLKFEGLNDRTAVSELTNDLVFIKTSELPDLTEDEFYLHEIIGLDVYEVDGSYLGVIIEILETGANDVYLIKDDNGHEVLIPAIEEMVLDLNLDEQKMIVAKMEWYGEGE